MNKGAPSLSAVVVARNEQSQLAACLERLRFADETENRTLGPGDHIHIAPHRQHRVEWTDPAMPTVWLAIFYGA